MPAPMVRRILILANPISGGGRGRLRAERLATILTARGASVDLHLMTQKGDGATQAAATSTARHDTIVAVGGDGTVREILNGITDFDIALAVLPMGTANVLACELRLPRHEALLADLVLQSTPTRVALAIADTSRFLLFAGIGFDGALVRRVEQVRRGALGKLRWLPPILHVVHRWPHHDIRFRTGDGPWHEGYSQVLITRVRNYGGILKMPVGGLLDPTLHVLAFRQRSRLAYAGAALRALTARLRIDRDVEHHQATEVTVESQAGPTPIQIDGDDGGDTPVHVRMLATTVLLYGAV